MTDIPRLSDPAVNATQQMLQQQADILRQPVQPETSIPQVETFNFDGHVHSPINYEQERQQTLNLYQQALRADPAMYQKAQEFAKQRGLDPAVADANVDVMNDMAAAEQRNMQRLKQDAPNLYELLQNPFYAKMAARETDKLARAEVSTGGWLGRQIETQLRQLEYAKLGLQAWQNGGDPDTLERLRYLRKLQGLYQRENEDSWLGWGASTAIQTAMFIGEAAAVTAGTALASGPAGWVTGPAAGVAFSSAVEGGSVLADFYLENEDRKAQGKSPIDVNAALPAIAGASVVSGSLDMLGLKAVKGPWRSQMIRGALNASAETFKDMTAQQAWSAFRKNLLTSWGGETLTEGMQKAIMVAGEHIARASSDPAYGSRVDWSKLGEEMWNESWKEIGTAAVGIGPLSLLGASRRVRRDLMMARGSEHHRDRWRAATEAIKGTELDKNAPSTAGMTLARQIRENGITHLYINARDLRAELENADAFEEVAIASEQGVSPERVRREAGDAGRASRTLREKLPDVADQLDNAVDDTADIKISVEDFHTHMSGRRIGMSLDAKELIKYDPDGMTKVERDIVQKQVERQLEAAAALAPTELPTVAGPEQAVGGQPQQVVTGQVQMDPVMVFKQEQSEADAMQARTSAEYVSKGLFPDTEEGRQDADTAAALEVLHLQKVAAAEGITLAEAAATQGIQWQGAEEPAAEQPAQAAPEAAQEAAAAPEAAPVAQETPQTGNVAHRLQAAVLRQLGVLADLHQRPASRWAAGRMSDEEFADAVIAYERPVRPDERKAQLVSVLGTAKKVAEWQRGSAVKRLASMGMPAPQQAPTPVPERETLQTPQVMSTRVPQAKGFEMEALDKLQLVDLETMKTDPDLLAANLAALKKMQVPYLWDESKSVEEQIDGFVQFMADNLLFLHSNFKQEWRERAEMWYVGARRIVDWMAKRYSLSPMQSAGILAVLSPQKNWFENVSMADRIADVLTANRDARWTPQQEAMWQTMLVKADAAVAKAEKVLREFKLPQKPVRERAETDAEWEARSSDWKANRKTLLAQYDAEKQAYDERLEEIENEIDEASELEEDDRVAELEDDLAAHKLTKPKKPTPPRRIVGETDAEFAEREAAYPAALKSAEEDLAKLTRAVPKRIETRDKLRAYDAGESMTRVRTQTLGDVLAAGDFKAAGYWVRLFDESFNSRSFAIITPEGGMGGPSMSKTGENKLRWGSYGTIQKAISIFEDGRAENISVQLGNAHKVRNFFDNMYAPWFEPAATMDTHAIAASLMQSLSASDPEVSWGLGGNVSSSILGLHGGYAIILAAYKRYASNPSAQVQIRAGQSITWEAIRAFFPAADKKRLRPLIKALWEKYRNGDATAQETRQAIFDLRIAELRKDGQADTAFTTPEWVGIPTTLEPASSYAGDSRAAMDAIVNERAQAKADPTITLTLPVRPAAGDAALNARWNQMTPEQQRTAASAVVAEIVPQVLAEFELAGEVGTTTSWTDGQPSTSLTVKIRSAPNAQRVATTLLDVLQLDRARAISARPFKGATQVAAAKVRVAAGTTNEQIESIMSRLAAQGLDDTHVQDGSVLVVLPSDVDAGVAQIQSALVGDAQIESIDQSEVWSTYDRATQADPGQEGGSGDVSGRRRLDRWRAQADELLVRQVNKVRPADAANAVRQWRRVDRQDRQANWRTRRTNPGPNLASMVGNALGTKVSGVEWVMPEQFRQIIRDAGVRPRRVLELDPGTEASAGAFRAAISAVKAGQEYGAAVYVYDQADYQKMRLFVTEDGTSGFALKDDGDIVSVFSKGGGHAWYLVDLAVAQGGWKADSFDTVLPHLYAPHGLRAVARMPWNEELKPEGWVYETFKEWNDGRPDVLWYAYDREYFDMYDQSQGPMQSDFGVTMSLQEQAKPTKPKKGKPTKLSSMAFKPLDEEYSAQVKELGLDTPEGYAKAKPQEKAMLWQYVRNAATAAGYDLAAYHGTKTKAATKLPSTKPFTVFRTVVPIELGAHFSVERAVGMSFALQNVEYPVGTSDVKRAENQLFDVYLRVKNPLRLKDEGNWVEHRILKQMQNLGLELESKEPLSIAMLRLQIKAKQELMARPELRIHPLLERKLEDMEADGATQQELNDATEKFVSAMAETRALQLLIMELGYDSVVYVNRREVVIGEEQHRGDMPDARRRRLEAAIYRDADVGLTDAEFLARVPEARDAYIVWEPASIKSADPVTFDENGRMIPLSERFNVKKNSILYSSGAVPPGQPQRTAEFDLATRQARLFDVGNLRAHLHEQGHNMMRWLFEAAQMPNPRPGVVRDVQILLQWFGVPDLDAWNNLSAEEQEAHWETFAYNWERYLFEGVAPSHGLRAIFERMSRWVRRYYREVVENINSVYRAATGRDLPMLTNEVRAVMGRMLTAEQSVDESIQAHGLEAIFQTREEFPGTDEEWEWHREEQERGRSAAVDQLQTETMKQLRFAEPSIAKAHVAQARAVAKVRERVRAEVASEISLQPAYRMINYFKTGKLVGPEGELIRDDEKSEHRHKLDRDALERMTNGKKYMRIERTPDGQFRTVEANLDRYQRRGGVDPEQLATAFGFVRQQPDATGMMVSVIADVDTMMQVLASAPDLKDAIEAETQARMERQYGELLDPKAQQQAVWEAVHGEIRARMVAAEALWLDNNLSVMAQQFNPTQQRKIQQAKDALAAIEPQIKAAKAERELMLSEVTLVEQMDLQRLTYLDMQIAALEKQRARFSAAERSTVPQRILAQAAAGVARRNLGRRIIGDINARDFVAQEQRAARDARDAMTNKSGDLTTSARNIRYRAASQHKQRQLLFHQMAAEALSIRRETELFRTFVSGLFNIGATRAKQIEMNYVHAAQALLAELGYAPESYTPERVAQIYQTIEQLDPVLWGEIKPTLDGIRQQIQAMPPAGPGAEPVPAWRRLTVEQWRAMRDVVEGLYDAARERGQYQTAERRQSFRATRDELMQAIAQRTARGPIPGEERRETELEVKVGWLRSWFSSLKRVEHYMLKLDGGTEGTWTRLIWKPINAAFVSYETRRHEVLRQYADILRSAPLDQDLPRDQRRIEFRRRDGSLVYTFEDIGELLGALLHTGNASNKRKMILGGSASQNPFGRMVQDPATGERVLDSADFDAFVERLNEAGRLRAEHWQFLQRVWDLNESMLPGIQWAHKHITGKIMRTVGRNEIVNRYGTFAGGYVPARIDGSKSAIGKRVESLSELQADMRNQMPMAQDGFTRERVESVHEPLVFDLRMVEQHLDQVVRYTEIAPTANDLNRLLTDYTVANAMFRMDKNLYDGVLRPWLSRALNNTTFTPHEGKGWNWLFNALRRNTTIGKMFMNIPNALQNLSGLPIALLRIPPRYWAHAIFSFTSGGWTQMGQNARQSAFMDNHLGNQMTALVSEMRNYVERPSAYGRMTQWVQQHGLFLQGFTQNMVDVITWNAAFDQSMAEADAALDQSEARAQAIRYADSVVRTSQLSLRAIDVSRLEAGTPFIRLLTQFASYFNSVAQANLTAFEAALRSVGYNKTRAVPGLLYAYLVGLALPAVVGDALIRLLGRGFEEEDDDGRMVSAWMDVFVNSQLRFAAGAIPFGQQAMSLTLNQWDDQRYNDRMSAGPAIESLMRGSAGMYNLLSAMLTEDGKLRPNTPRDAMSFIQMIGGGPIEPLGRPVGFLSKVAMGAAEPETPMDWIRGLISGQVVPGTGQ